jgi:hypothetical protein
MERVRDLGTGKEHCFVTRSDTVIREHLPNLGMAAAFQDSYYPYIYAPYIPLFVTPPIYFNIPFIRKWSCITGLKFKKPYSHKSLSYRWKYKVRVKLRFIQWRSRRKLRLLKRYSQKKINQSWYRKGTF